MSGTQQHPYHLVEPSPWPLVGSISGLITAIGAIMFMHERDYGIFVLSFGLASILFTMFMWWRDVIREAEFQGHHTPIVQIGMRYGMMLFIASEVMFFNLYYQEGFPKHLMVMNLMCIEL